MVTGQRLTPFTTKWDHHFIVSGVWGKVITILHVPTGKTQRWNRHKIRLVDPEVSWEGMHIRPLAQQTVVPTAYVFTGPHLGCRRTLCAPLLPQYDITVPIPPHTQGRKQNAPDSQDPLVVAKRRRWQPEQMKVLCFVYSTFYHTSTEH